MQMKKIADEKAGTFGGRIFNFRPCLFAAIFLCLGICFSRLSFVHGYPLWFVLSPFAVPVGIGLIYRTKKAWSAGVLLALAFTVGFCGYQNKAEEFTSAPFYDKTVKVYGCVTEVERIDEDTLNLVLDEITFDGKEVEGKLFVKALHNEEENGRVRVSDFIFVECRLLTSNALSGKDAVYPDTFASDIRFTSISNTFVQVAGRKFDPFGEIRDLLRERLYLGMDEDMASVCYGILIGDTSGMEESLLENVRVGGIAHVFAVSGLHVGTLFTAFVFVLSKIKFLREKRILCFSFVATLLLLYGGICGYSASVVRAIVTCLCAYSFKLFGLKRDMLEWLSFAVIILLAFQPAQLFCVGFQLSFTACYGIAFLAKPLATALERTYRELFMKTAEISTMPAAYPQGTRGKLFSYLSVCVSAQAATAPILLNAFGYVSNAGLLLNMIFVPIVSCIFPFTVLFGVVALCLPTYLAVIILHLPNAIWSALFLVFRVVEFTPSLVGVKLSFSALLFYYGLLLFCSDKFNLSDKMKFGIRAVFAGLFILAFFLCF